MVFFIGDRLAEYRREALAEAVNVRARGVLLDLARQLHQDWRNLKAVEDYVTSRGPEVVPTSLNLMVGDGERISWAGVASVDGTVMAASRNMLEGADVSERPWFRNGLRGDFAGDVHPAVLLADLLPPTSGEPRRFLDMATPITDESGTTQGVLGIHLNHDWVQRYLTESAHAVGLDVFVVDRAGNVVLRSDDSTDPLDRLQSYRAAMTGAAQTIVEHWPNGTRHFFSTVVPSVGYRDLPSFGWSMIARIDNRAHLEQSVLGPFLSYVVAFGAALGLLTLLFIVIFVRPITRLADCAQATLQGETVYPNESRTTSEARVLNAAIARLQTELED
ncbi:cache domain-containing protein [Roseibium salinum]|nr:cache domain-containing protein [Roseibium salinum]